MRSSLPWLEPANLARDAWAPDGFAPLPGDTIAIPDEASRRVETVYLCAEPSGDDVTAVAPSAVSWRAAAPAVRSGVE